MHGPPNQPSAPTPYGYQQQPAPVGAPPPFPLWPVIVVTIFFSLFGLIPTIIGSNRASQRREDGSRYWIAFVLSLLGAFVLYAIIVVVMVFVVFATAVGVVSTAIDNLPTYSPTPYSTSTTAATTGPCTYTPDSTRGTFSVPLPDDPDPTPTAPHIWKIGLTGGTVIVDLDGAAAPCAVQSIVHLTQEGFYDGSDCPRTVDSGIFLLPCGDPTGTGAGGPGYSFIDENLADADYSAAAVVMANSGPDTNGSQFFILTKDANGTLPKDYTVVGQVSKGLELVTEIVAEGNDGSNPSGGGQPTTPVSIVAATVS